MPPHGLLDDGLDALTAARGASAVSTSHGLAAAMVALLDSTKLSVLDPAAGEAELLIWWAARAGDGKWFGAELAADTWRVAKSRLLLRGLDADLRQADSLHADPFPSTRVAAVMVDPPLYDERSTPDDWIRYAVRHLDDGGRAVIVVPARSGPRSVLAEPFRRREVEAVVVLPASMRPDAREPLALAVVGTGIDPFERVLVVDLRRTTRGVSSRQAVPSREDARRSDRLPVEWLHGLLERFRRDGDVEPDQRSRTMTAGDAAEDFLELPGTSRRGPGRAEALARRLVVELSTSDDPASRTLRDALAAYLEGRSRAD
jgi:SAM-dependent methyltransferase